MNGGKYPPSFTGYGGSPIGGQYIDSLQAQPMPNQQNAYSNSFSFQTRPQVGSELPNGMPMQPQTAQLGRPGIYNTSQNSGMRQIQPQMMSQVGSQMQGRQAPVIGFPQSGQSSIPTINQSSTGQHNFNMGTLNPQNIPPLASELQYKLLSPQQVAQIQQATEEMIRLSKLGRLPPDYVVKLNNNIQILNQQKFLRQLQSQQMMSQNMGQPMMQPMMGQGMPMQYQNPMYGQVPMQPQMMQPQMMQQQYNMQQMNLMQPQNQMQFVNQPQVPMQQQVQPQQQQVQLPQQQPEPTIKAQGLQIQLGNKPGTQTRDFSQFGISVGSSSSTNTSAHAAQTASKFGITAELPKGRPPPTGISAGPAFGISIQRPQDIGMPKQSPIGGFDMQQQQRPAGPSLVVERKGRVVDFGHNTKQPANQTPEQQIPVQDHSQFAIPPLTIGNIGGGGGGEHMGFMQQNYGMPMMQEVQMPPQPVIKSSGEKERRKKKHRSSKSRPYIIDPVELIMYDYAFVAPNSFANLFPEEINYDYLREMIREIPSNLLGEILDKDLETKMSPAGEIKEEPKTLQIQFNKKREGKKFKLVINKSEHMPQRAEPVRLSSDNAYSDYTSSAIESNNDSESETLQVNGNYRVAPSPIAPESPTPVIHQGKLNLDMPIRVLTPTSENQNGAPHKDLPKPAGRHRDLSALRAGFSGKKEEPQQMIIPIPMSSSDVFGEEEQKQAKEEVVQPEMTVQKPSQTPPEQKIQLQKANQPDSVPVPEQQPQTPPQPPVQMLNEDGEPVVPAPPPPKKRRIVKDGVLIKLDEQAQNKSEEAEKEKEQQQPQPKPIEFEPSVDDPFEMKMLPQPKPRPRELQRREKQEIIMPDDVEPEKSVDDKYNELFSLVDDKKRRSRKKDVEKQADEKPAAPAKKEEPAPKPDIAPPKRTRRQQPPPEAAAQPAPEQVKAVPEPEPVQQPAPVPDQKPEPVQEQKPEPKPEPTPAPAPKPAPEETKPAVQEEPKKPEPVENTPSKEEKPKADQLPNEPSWLNPPSEPSWLNPPSEPSWLNPPEEPVDFDKLAKKEEKPEPKAEEPVPQQTKSKRPPRRVQKPLDGYTPVETPAKEEEPTPAPEEPKEPEVVVQHTLEEARELSKNIKRKNQHQHPHKQKPKEKTAEGVNEDANAEHLSKVFIPTIIPKMKTEVPLPHPAMIDYPLEEAYRPQIVHEVADWTTLTMGLTLPNPKERTPSVIRKENIEKKKAEALKRHRNENKGKKKKSDFVFLEEEDEGGEYVFLHIPLEVNEDGTPIWPEQESRFDINAITRELQKEEKRYQTEMAAEIKRQRDLKDKNMSKSKKKRMKANMKKQNNLSVLEYSKRLKAEEAEKKAKEEAEKERVFLFEKLGVDGEVVEEEEEDPFERAPKPVMITDMKSLIEEDEEDKQEDAIQNEEATEQKNEEENAEETHEVQPEEIIETPVEEVKEEVKEEEVAHEEEDKAEEAPAQEQEQVIEEEAVNDETAKIDEEQEEDVKEETAKEEAVNEEVVEEAATAAEEAEEVVEKGDNAAEEVEEVVAEAEEPPQETPKDEQNEVITNNEEEPAEDAKIEQVVDETPIEEPKVEEEKDQVEETVPEHSVEEEIKPEDDQKQEVEAANEAPAEEIQQEMPQPEWYSFTSQAGFQYTALAEIPDPTIYEKEDGSYIMQNPENPEEFLPYTPELHAHYFEVVALAQYNAYVSEYQQQSEQTNEQPSAEPEITATEETETVEHSEDKKKKKDSSHKKDSNKSKKEEEPLKEFKVEIKPINERVYAIDPDEELTKVPCVIPSIERFIDKEIFDMADEDLLSELNIVAEGVRSRDEMRKKNDYNRALKKLVQNGKITQKQMDEKLAQSNIDSASLTSHDNQAKGNKKKQKKQQPEIPKPPEPKSSHQSELKPEIKEEEVSTPPPEKEAPKQMKTSSRGLHLAARKQQPAEPQAIEQPKYQKAPAEQAGAPPKRGLSRWLSKSKAQDSIPKEEPKPEPKEEQKPEPEIKPEPEEEPKPEPEEEIKPEPEEEQKPEPKEEPKPELEEEQKPEPKEEPEPEEEPKPETKEEQKPEPEEEPKPEPEEEPKFEVEQHRNEEAVPEKQEEESESKQPQDILPSEDPDRWNLNIFEDLYSITPEQASEIAIDVCPEIYQIQIQELISKAGSGAVQIFTDLQLDDNMEVLFPSPLSIPENEQQPTEEIKDEKVSNIEEEANDKVNEEIKQDEEQPLEEEKLEESAVNDTVETEMKEFKDSKGVSYFAFREIEEPKYIQLEDGTIAFYDPASGQFIPDSEEARAYYFSTMASLQNPLDSELAQDNEKADTENAMPQFYQFTDSQGITYNSMQQIDEPLVELSDQGEIMYDPFTQQWIEHNNAAREYYYNSMASSIYNAYVEKYQNKGEPEHANEQTLEQENIGETNPELNQNEELAKEPSSTEKSVSSKEENADADTHQPEERDYLENLQSVENSELKGNEDIHNLDHEEEKHEEEHHEEEHHEEEHHEEEKHEEEKREEELKEEEHHEEEKHEEEHHEEEKHEEEKHEEEHHEEEHHEEEHHEEEKHEEEHREENENIELPHIEGETNEDLKESDIVKEMIVDKHPEEEKELNEIVSINEESINVTDNHVAEVTQEQVQLADNSYMNEVEALPSEEMENKTNILKDDETTVMNDERTERDSTAIEGTKDNQGNEEEDQIQDLEAEPAQNQDEIPSPMWTEFVDQFGVEYTAIHEIEEPQIYGNENGDQLIYDYYQNAYVAYDTESRKRYFEAMVQLQYQQYIEQYQESSKANQNGEIANEDQGYINENEGIINENEDQPNENEVHINENEEIINENEEIINENEETINENEDQPNENEVHINENEEIVNENEEADAIQTHVESNDDQNEEIIYYESEEELQRIAESMLQMQEFKDALDVPYTALYPIDEPTVGEDAEGNYVMVDPTTQQTVPYSDSARVSYFQFMSTIQYSQAYQDLIEKLRNKAAQRENRNVDKANEETSNIVEENDKQINEEEHINEAPEQNVDFAEEDEEEASQPEEDKEQPKENKKIEIEEPASNNQHVLNNSEKTEEETPMIRSEFDSIKDDIAQNSITDSAEQIKVISRVSSHSERFRTSASLSDSDEVKEVPNQDIIEIADDDDQLASLNEEIREQLIDEGIRKALEETQRMAVEESRKRKEEELTEQLRRESKERREKKYNEIQQQINSECQKHEYELRAQFAAQQRAIDEAFKEESAQRRKGKNQEIRKVERTHKKESDSLQKHANEEIAQKEQSLMQQREEHINGIQAEKQKKLENHMKRIRSHLRKKAKTRTLEEQEYCDKIHKMAINRTMKSRRIVDVFEDDDIVYTSDFPSNINMIENLWEINPKFVSETFPEIYLHDIEYMTYNMPQDIKEIYLNENQEMNMLDEEDIQISINLAKTAVNFEKQFNDLETKFNQAMNKLHSDYIGLAHEKLEGINEKMKNQINDIKQRYNEAKEKATEEYNRDLAIRKDELEAQIIRQREEDLQNFQATIEEAHRKIDEEEDQILAKKIQEMKERLINEEAKMMINYDKDDIIGQMSGSDYNSADMETDDGEEDGLTSLISQFSQSLTEESPSQEEKHPSSNPADIEQEEVPPKEIKFGNLTPPRTFSRGSYRSVDSNDYADMREDIMELFPSDYNKLAGRKISSNSSMDSIDSIPDSFRQAFGQLERQDSLIIQKSDIGDNDDFDDDDGLFSYIMNEEDDNDDNLFRPTGSDITLESASIVRPGKISSLKVEKPKAKRPMTPKERMDQAKQMLDADPSILGVIIEERKYLRMPNGSTIEVPKGFEDIPDEMLVEQLMDEGFEGVNVDGDAEDDLFAEMAAAEDFEDFAAEGMDLQAKISQGIRSSTDGIVTVSHAGKDIKIELPNQKKTITVN